MEYNVLLAVFNSLLLVGAGVVYMAPLRKRRNWLCWLPAAFGLCALIIHGGYQSDGGTVAVCHLLTYVVLAAMVNRCTTLSPMADCYCAIWIFITAEAGQEIWFWLRLHAGGIHMLDLKSGMEMLAVAAILYLILSLTIARRMPHGDIYQVGLGQLTTGILLGGLFVTLSYLLMLPGKSETGEMVIIGLCQIYCVSLLYLQTELAKKRQAERKLDMLNLLCSFGAQQYAVALQNVGIVNQKCEELEQKIRQMQQYLPEEFRQEARTAIEDAQRACDTVVKSGNEVLDIVLTEKKLLAENSGTQINCIADGKLLGFMETVDIYTLFSYALEMAVEEVEGIADENRRMIDLLIHESQNFLVINFCYPLRTRAEQERYRFCTAKSKVNLNGFKIMVIHKLIEKYNGMHTLTRKDGFFTLKILIPLSQRKK